MDPSALRLWRAFGPAGTLGILTAACLALTMATSGTGGAPWSSVIPVLGGAVLSIAGLVWRWGRTIRPVDTVAWEHVLGAFELSSEKYCLMLRPFGQDYRVLVRDDRGTSMYARPQTPLEQVVARAIRKKLSCSTYAIVDQSVRRAPPGPVWLRADDEEWHTPAGALIAGAASIILILSPGEDLRASLEWELRQIIALQRQEDVIILLPPPAVQGYQQAFENLCQVLALFAVYDLDRSPALGILDVQTSGASLDDLEPWQIDRYRADVNCDMASPAVIAAKLSRTSPSVALEANWWYTPKALRRHQVDAKTYLNLLDEALDTISDGC